MGAITHYLTASLCSSGFHPAGWRFCSGTAFPIGRRLQTMARLAEGCGLQAVWLGQPGGDGIRLDPLPLLGSLIGVTEQIGLGAYWAVDHAEPFHVARVFATLDHLSGGRTAWIVGLGGGASLTEQYRHVPPLDPQPYADRAAEMIDVAGALWDSWEDEGFALDVPSGRFADPDRVHPVNHAGAFFTVRGPLNVPRPVQGKPPIVMTLPADGPLRRVATQAADVVLLDCTTPQQARAARNALPGTRLLINVMPIFGGTEAEAQSRARMLDAAGSGGPACLRFIGTPEQLVASWAVWLAEGACDGFNLMPAVLPDDLEVIAAAVMPLAQKYGQVQRGYAGRTLRDHLGLSRPRSRFAA